MKRFAIVAAVLAVSATTASANCGFNCDYTQGFRDMQAQSQRNYDLYLHQRQQQWEYNRRDDGINFNTYVPRNRYYN